MAGRFEAFTAVFMPYRPLSVMVGVQVLFGGLNFFSKLAIDTGMTPFVLVAYRQLFAVLILAPVAYYLERNTRPPITRMVLLQAVISSVLGATANQGLYAVSLKYTSPTISVALTNLLPAMTFILAIAFRMEAPRIHRRSGQGKIVGTFVCIGGAMLTTLVKGPVLNKGKNAFSWWYATEVGRHSGKGMGSFIGPVLVLASCFAWAGWFILQARINAAFPAPLTSTSMMFFFATLECVIIGWSLDHHVGAWSLTSPVRLFAALYSGVVASALAYYLMSRCVEWRGPLYVSAFTPLLLVIVGLANWAFLDEKLHLGSLIGSAFIVLGLYILLWGKGREETEVAAERAEEERARRNEDLEGGGVGDTTTLPDRASLVEDDAPDTDIPGEEDEDVIRQIN